MPRNESPDETLEQGTPAIIPEDKQEELWDQVQADRALTQADDAVEGQAGEDPLAGLPEPTRKLIEQIQAKTVEQDANLKDVGQKLARAHGTIGNLTKQLGDSLKTLTQMKPAIDAVQAKEQAEADAKQAEKLARKTQLREELADIPGVVEYMDMVIPDVKPEVKPEPKAEPTELPADREAMLIAQRELSDRHPGWMALTSKTAPSGKDFQQWKAKQPDDIQALAESDDVADADKMLTLFKKHKEDAARVAQVEADRAARLRRGESVQGRGTALQGEDTSEDALWDKVTRDRAKARA